MHVVEVVEAPVPPPQTMKLALVAPVDRAEGHEPSPSMPVIQPSPLSCKVDAYFYQESQLIAYLVGPKMWLDYGPGDMVDRVDAP